jgi:rubrerythrin
VPLPGSAKGMLKTALNKLVGVSPEVLIDKLGERLAFERGGVRLYDALLAKAKAIDTLDKSMLQTLQHFREEEAEHLALVKAAIEKLGADPTAMTPCANVAGCLNMGVMETITDPRTNLAQCLNALLTAELSDNAGWELLIDLANASGQGDIADSFGKALSQEQVHMQTVKEWLSQEVLRQV